MHTEAFTATPPEWLDDLAMQSATATPIRVNLGGKLELRCPARGNPLPEIRWLKNEQVVTQSSLIGDFRLRNLK